MEPTQTTMSALVRAKVLSRARSTISARKDAFTILPHQRLKQLHRISHSLIAACDPEATIATVVGLLDDTVLVRSAVCIHCGGSPSSSIWSADGVSYEQIEAATARALSCLEYLLGPSTLLPQRAASRGQLPVPGSSVVSTFIDGRRVILLPLAVEHRGCFGVLQIEGFERFTEVDLVFISAVASELALALDRQTTTQRQAAATPRQLGTVAQQISGEARSSRSDSEPPAPRAERLRTAMTRVTRAAVQAQADRTRLAATELRKQYEAVLSNMDRAVIWEADPQTLRLSYLSAQVEALLGFPASRWLEEANFFMQRVHPDDRQLVEYVFSSALTREGPHCEHRMVSADGSILWFQTSVHLSCGRALAPALQGISLAIPGGPSAAKQVPAGSPGPA